MVLALIKKTEEVVLLNENPGITVNPNPICKSEAFLLSAVVTDSALIKDYTWTIGTTTIADTTRTIYHTLGSYGTYAVTLTTEDINGCLNTTTIPNLVVVSGPRANFAVNGPGGCEGSTISFTDLSTLANSPIVQWTWGFGDGIQQTYTSAPFSHTYNQSGSYSVTLAIRDNDNCFDTITIPNAVLITRPIAAFRADTFYCPNAALQFIDTSSGSGLTYNWTFGDGGTSTLQNPTHAYPAGDNVYTVKLKIRDIAGCEDSVTKLNYINIRSPRAAFDVIDSSGICIPLQTSFTFQGTNYQSYLWDFGDGGTSTAQNPAHFYNSYGTYTATLFLTGPGGCRDSAQTTVNLYNPWTNTQIQYGPDTACNTITTTFNISVPPGFDFIFNFADGVVDSSRQTTLTHTYTSPGIYYPYVLLIDKFGCGATINTATPIVVYGAIPLFGKNRTEFCDNGEVFFLNYTLNNDPIVSTVWDFGDGATSTQTEPSHIFNGANTYLVTLTVTTENQCVSSFTDTVRVYATPQLTIAGKDTICINSPEIYNGLLAQSDSTIAWQWNLGNGSTAQTQQATVNYASPGDYTINLIATNKLDCADTASTTIHVTTPPTATANRVFAGYR